MTADIRTAAQREARYALSDPPSMDDRKVLAELWQASAPLPEGGLSDGFHEALIAVADWGWRRAVEHFEIDALDARVTPTREQVQDVILRHLKRGTSITDGIMGLMAGLAEGES